jgi:hypothetical protein
MPTCRCHLLGRRRPRPADRPKRPRWPGDLFRRPCCMHSPDPRDGLCPAFSWNGKKLDSMPDGASCHLYLVNPDLSGLTTVDDSITLARLLRWAGRAGSLDLVPLPGPRSPGCPQASPPASGSWLTPGDLPRSEPASARDTSKEIWSAASRADRGAAGELRDVQARQ